MISLSFLSKQLPVALITKQIIQMCFAFICLCVCMNWNFENVFVEAVAKQILTAQLYFIKDKYTFFCIIQYVHLWFPSMLNTWTNMLSIASWWFQSILMLSTNDKSFSYLNSSIEFLLCSSLAQFPCVQKMTQNNEY